MNIKREILERTTSVLGQYLIDLEIPARFLNKNTSILDLGSGNSMFAREAANFGLKVFSLDRDFSVWTSILYQYIWLPKEYKMPQSIVLDIWKKILSRCTNASMTKIPFADSSFQLIVSHDAFPQVLNSLNDIKQVLSEVIRTMAPEGEARFFRFNSERWPKTNQENSKKAIVFLKKQIGISFQIKTKRLKNSWTPKPEKVQILIIKKN
jgi:SAM-dependent methyltransferase